MLLGPGLGVTHPGESREAVSPAWTGCSALGPATPPCWVPSALARSSTSPRLRAGQRESTAQGWRGKHRPEGCCCGCSWSDLWLSPLGPHRLKRTLPPGPDSGIRSTALFRELPTSRATSGFPSQSQPRCRIWK